MPVEPIIHCVIGAQFGDYEFDVGKSTRWNMYFADRHFVLDVNSGDTRYFVVNWDKTFPQAKHGVTGINYFKRPVDFRKEQFAKASAAWQFGDDDWCLFVDAHEGFSVDNRSLPTDWPMEPFQSYVYREIQRAIDNLQDWACLPFFAFVRNGEPENVEYPIRDPIAGGVDIDATFTALQPISVPYYVPHEGLVRLIKVSALRDPDWDWTLLDQPTTPDAGAKAQIISYGYAHWNTQDIIPPATEVEPLVEANDSGYRMRQKISQVRPIIELPFDPDDWVDPSEDDPGLAGPTGDLGNYAPVDLIDRVIPIPDPEVEALLTPLYDQVVRLNLRDGVWYEGTDGMGALGNIPLSWDETEQKWVASYPPEEWHEDNFEVVQ